LFPLPSAKDRDVSKAGFDPPTAAHLVFANCAHLVIVVLAFHRPRKPIVASAAVGLMQTF
jgi:hypothetical protein